MSKIYCTNVCQYRVDEVCSREIVNITSYGCHSYKCVSREKDPNVWSTDPWENYDKQPTPIEPLEEYKQRARILLKEDKQQ